MLITPYTYIIPKSLRILCYALPDLSISPDTDFFTADGSTYVDLPKPHLGYMEQNSYELYFGKAFENVVNFINGNATNIANPEVIGAHVSGL